MNDKQRLFVENYLTNFNATKSAEEAGYSKLTARSIGQRLLTNVDIRETVDKRVKEIIAKTDDKRVKLLNFWENIIDDDKSTESHKMKASENIGKYLAMFTERLETTLIVKNKSDLEKLPDDELRRLAEDG